MCIRDRREGEKPKVMPFSLVDADADERAEEEESDREA